MPNNLEERTKKFSEEIIIFASIIPKTVITLPLISQLVRAVTSVGANYCEANGACSKRDFKNKLYICKKEAKESKYWLDLISKAIPELKNDCQKLWQEAHELTLIFSKSILTIENKEKTKA
ncbi:MAG: four helix bundle protein [Candidatus Parcubacteria bacterium]|nr:four helix bundle protein [Candidatus Parcubacteria bacterium]